MDDHRGHRLYLGALGRALTLHQPWAWAIARLGKDIENRIWRPPPWLIGQRVAIHAGKRWDPGWSPDIVDMAIHAAMDHAYMSGDRLYHLGAGIVAVVRVVGVVTNSESPWFVGPFGWVLEDIMPVDPPIPCQGRQGLWKVVPDIQRELEKRVAALSGRESG